MPYVRQLPSGLWRVQYRDQEGKRQGASFETRKEALTWGKQREVDVALGRHEDPHVGRIPIREWEKKWWSARVVAETTRAANRIRLDKYVIPRWGDVMLDEVSHMDVQAWIRELELSGAIGGDSIRNCHSLLCMILESALREGKIKANLARGVSLPPKGIGREVYLTGEQVEGLVSWFDAQGRDVDGTIVMVAVYLGLRWGEIAGLARQQVSMLRKTVEVRDVVEEIGASRVLRAYPKGKNRRIIPIAEPLLLRLAEHQRLHPCDADGQLLFRRDDVDVADEGKGYGPRPESLSRAWARQFAKAVAAVDGVPARTAPHDLRHTFASWLVEDGVSLRTVQYLMGHASITTTERYSHLAPDVHDRTLEALERRSRESVRKSARRATGSNGVQPRRPGDSPRA